MKISLACSLLLALVLPVFAAKTAAAAADKSSAAKPKKEAPASSTASAPGTNALPAAPVPASTDAPKAALTLDSYIATLATDVPLSKDEQTDVKTYYLDDGAKLQDILNDASLSPLQQQQQVDDLRAARNSKIEALLADAVRQAEFLKVESDYRVALVQLAAQGGLVPTSPPPNVPQPTSTTPAQADQPSANIDKASAAAPAQ